MSKWIQPDPLSMSSNRKNSFELKGVYGIIIAGWSSNWGAAVRSPLILGPIGQKWGPGRSLFRTRVDKWKS
ncbi:hypothetical protein SDJN02_09352 [Cucurbita argyrosperma subsp. argyrosperma]|nr:hypothetical protein SDJN02_09352 [Cucurbita argyrosperma subsp. argyrosperma]